jgi:GNAT acetyltransferase-like protein
MGNPPPPRDGAYRIEILRSGPDLLRWREFWLQCAPTRDAHPDFFAMILEVTANVVAPYVLVLLRDGAPVAMLVARIDLAHVPIRLGYRTLFSLPVRCVFVVHGGVLGAVGSAEAEALVDRLRRSLESGDAEAVSIHFVDTASQFARAALARPGWILRDRFLQPQRHHFLDLRPLATGFLASLSKRERSHQRQRHKALLRDYEGSVEILRWDGVDDVGRLAAVAEAIARKSYQRGIGVGFADTREVRERLRFEARQGWLRSFVLHLDGVPRAFWIACLQSRLLLSEYLAFDPDHAKHSPGMYLLMRVIEEICDAPQGRACDIVDFGIGHAGYKERLGNTEHVDAMIWFFAPTLKGVTLNFCRLLAAAINRSAKLALSRFALLDHLKRGWRARAARRRQ